MKKYARNEIQSKRSKNGLEMRACGPVNPVKQQGRSNDRFWSRYCNTAVHTRFPVEVLGVLFPKELPADVPRRATDEDPSICLPETHPWTQMELLSPDSA